LNFKKGDLVTLDFSNSIGVVMKGPYEVSYKEFGQINVMIAYDVYFDSQIVRSVPRASLKKFGIDEEVVIDESEKF